MKIHIHNIFRSASVLAFAAFTFASCMQEEQPGESAVGYLCPPSVEIDVTLENLMKTKAVDMPVPADPDPDTFRYVVKDNSDAVKYDGVGYWSPIVMPAASYTVEAYNGTNGFGEVYFCGKAEGTIAPADDTVPEIKVSVGNAILGVTVDPDFAKHFTITRVELSAPDLDPVVFSDSEVGASPLSMIQDAWYFVPSKVDVTVAFEGVNPVGSAVTFTRTVPSSDNQPRSANMIVCKDANTAVITLPDQTSGAWAGRLYITPATFNANVSSANQAKVVYEVIPDDNGATPDDGEWSSLPVEQIQGRYYVAKGLANNGNYRVRARIGNLLSNVEKVTVKADLPQPAISLAHNNNGDADVMLTGTNATIDLNLPGILGTLYSEELLQTSAVLKKGTEIVRTSGMDQGLMEGEIANWPYLPQGSDYMLAVDYSLSGEAAFATTSVSNVKSDAPVFKVTLDQSYSSYDYGVGSDENGIAKDINFANTLTGAAAKTIFKVNVVSWGVSSDLLSKYSGGSTDFQYDGTSTSIPSTGTFTEQSLGEHTIYAKTTFDNVSADATRKHYITGLPYKNIPNTADKWTSSGNVEWSNDKVILQPNRESILTFDEFHIPNKINVSVNHQISGNWTTAFYPLKYTFSVGSTNFYNEEKCTSKTLTVTEGAATLTNTSKTITMKGYYGSSNAGYKITITSFELKYN